MGLAAVRKALCAAVDNAEIIVGGKQLTCYPRTPSAVNVPCFYVGEFTGDPQIDFGDVTDSYTFMCRVYTSEVDDETGQDAIDELLERSGPTSVRAVITAAAGRPGEYALSGACDDLKIVDFNGPHRFTVGLTTYYGAEIRVFVIGAGSGEV